MKSHTKKIFLLIVATLFIQNAFSQSSVDVVSVCSTGGTGTASDPWVGWENNSNCFNSDITAHFKPGYYSVTTQTFLHSNLTIQCEPGAKLVRNINNEYIFITVSGGENISIKECIFDNNSTVTSPSYISDIHIEASSNGSLENIQIIGNRFTNLSPRTTRLVYIKGPNGNGSSVAIKSNHISSSNRTDATAFGVYSMNNVAVQNNFIEKYGVIAVQQPSSGASATMQNLDVSKNHLIDIGYTNIFMRCKGGHDLEGVTVHGNLMVTEDMVQQKGLVGVGTTESSESEICETRNVVISGNIAQGFEGTAISLGSSKGQVNNATITGNSLDGRNRVGSIDPNSTSMGISVYPGSRNITISNNAIKNTARRCISAAGENLVVSNNTLEYCAQFNLTSPDPSQEGAIIVFNSDTLGGGKYINIIGNTIRNPFTSTLAASYDTSGIFLSNDSNVEFISIIGNIIIDDRTPASKGMDFGVEVGKQTWKSYPNQISVVNNDISGYIDAAWKSNGNTNAKRRFIGNIDNGYAGIQISNTTLGTSSSNSGSCLYYDDSTDAIFEDKDCDGIKDVAERSISHSLFKGNCGTGTNNCIVMDLNEDGIVQSSDICFLDAGVDADCDGVL